MYESGFSTNINTKKAWLVVAAMAFLVGLVAVQALGARPAGAVPTCWPDCELTDPGEPGVVRPVNDDFSAAEWLPPLSLVYGDTTHATLQPGEPEPHGATEDCGVLSITNSVWYRLTPEYTGEMKISTAGSSFDTVLGLYEGSDLASLRQVDCSNDNSSPNWTDNMTAWVRARQPYYLQVSGTGGVRSGTLQLYAAQTMVQSPPWGDPICWPGKNCPPPICDPGPCPPGLPWDNGNDNTAPTVDKVSPQGRGISPTSNVTATFSEAMDGHSVAGGAFSLMRKAALNLRAAPIAGAVRYTAATNKAILAPRRSLVDGATYVAGVVGGAEGVKDSAGNPLAADKA